LRRRPRPKLNCGAKERRRTRKKVSFKHFLMNVIRFTPVSIFGENILQHFYPDPYLSEVYRKSIVFLSFPTPFH
jgi:hypothetical protein